MIQQIEEASMNAWPALQTKVYDGWILRFTNGYTRRANSVNPLYPSKIDLKRKIEYCQRLYEQKNLPTIFKITESVYPHNLDSQEFFRYSPSSIGNYKSYDNVHNKIRKSA